MKNKITKFKEYFKSFFKGRINRKNYIFGLIFLIAIFFGLFGVGLLITLSIKISFFAILFLIVLSLFLIMYILLVFSLHIRRLHDTNSSGLWILLGPIATLYAIFKKGTGGINDYGEEPKDFFLLSVFNLKKYKK